MPKSPRLNWPFPNEDQDPWFEKFRAFINAVDASFFTTREDKNFVLFGGGTVSFDATSGLLSWTSPLEAVAATTGFHWLIPAPATPGSVTLQDGEFFFVELTRAPQSVQSLDALSGSRINTNDDSLVIAQRLGDAVIFRNGAVIGDGQSIILFGPRALVQVAHVVGVAGLQETAGVVYEGVGGFRFDPADYFASGFGITRTVKFQAILETTDDATPLPANVILRNITDGGTIAATALASSSLTPELVESAALDIGTDLPNGLRDYEVQIKLDDTSGSPTISDRIACKHAALRITWS
jgi:hypothetical protein